MMSDSIAVYAVRAVNHNTVVHITFDLQDAHEQAYRFNRNLMGTLTGPLLPETVVLRGKYNRLTGKATWEETVYHCDPT